MSVCVYRIPRDKLEEIPIVLNIKGTRDKPEFTLYIGRAMNMGGWKLKKSKWANPFPVKQYGLEESLRLYEEYLNENLLEDLHELNGQSLGCWCKPNRCHGDILRWYYIRCVVGIKLTQ